MLSPRSPDVHYGEGHSYSLKTLPPRRQNAEAQRTAPRGGYGHGTRTLWPGKVTPRDSGFVTVHGRVLTRSSSASQGTLGDVTMLRLSHWGGGVLASRKWGQGSCSAPHSVQDEPHGEGPSPVSAVLGRDREAS